MYFAEYIQILHKSLEPTKKRGEFTENVLKNLITNEKLLDYSTSSYNGFYDEKTDGNGANKVIVGDKIGKCAREIQPFLYSSKFVKYLNDLQFNIATKNELCDSFKREITDINIDNVPDKLADLLIQIITKTAKETISTKTKNISSNVSNNAESLNQEELKQSSINIIDNHNGDNSHNNIVINIASKNKDDLISLKDLISQLNACFLDLVEKGSRLHLLSWNCSDKQHNEKEQEFRILQDDFIEGNKKLRLYYLKFPELKENFDKMILLSSTMTFWYGFRNDGNNHNFVERDYQIEEYQKCIEEVWEALSSL